MRQVGHLLLFNSSAMDSGGAGPEPGHDDDDKHLHSNKQINIITYTNLFCSSFITNSWQMKYLCKLLQKNLKNWSLIITFILGTRRKSYPLIIIISQVGIGNLNLIRC